MRRVMALLLAGLGYEVRRMDAGGFNPRYLARLCLPATVFDIGVGRGTEELYGAYPRARFVLVEPLEEFSAVLLALSRRLDCILVRKALGEREGELLMSVEADPEISSLCARPRPAPPPGFRKVSVTTLDSLAAEIPGLNGPILLKIDVEGFELQVLKGGRRFLKSVETVIVETSVAQRFSSGPTLEDIVLFMRDNGFAVFDFLTIIQRPDGPGTHMTDVVFKRKASR